MECSGEATMGLEKREEVLEEEKVVRSSLLVMLMLVLFLVYLSFLF